VFFFIVKYVPKLCKSTVQYATDKMNQNSQNVNYRIQGDSR